MLEFQTNIWRYEVVNDHPGYWPQGVITVRLSGDQLLTWGEIGVDPFEINLPVGSVGVAMGYIRSHDRFDPLGAGGWLALYGDLEGGQVQFARGRFWGEIGDHNQREYDMMIAGVV